jgi:hypothetical protein
LKKETGFKNNCLKPLRKHGMSGSNPLALKTIALSTIEMIGATDKADTIAHALSRSNEEPKEGDAEGLADVIGICDTS